MKQLINQRSLRYFLASICLIVLQVQAFAQEKVEVNGNDVGTWFKNNWMWVAGIVLLLLLIIIFSGGKSKSKKTTTVVKDNYGDVKRVTTTEVED